MLQVCYRVTVDDLAAVMTGSFVPMISPNFPIVVLTQAMGSVS